MNNFYGILKILDVSDITIDYYNKCKFSYEIICIDNDTKFKIICNEKFIENIYPKLEIGKYIFIHGHILFTSTNLIILPKEITLELVL